MRNSLAALACAAFLIGCATDQDTTIDPTTAGSLRASGSGAVALPTDHDSSTNALDNPPAPTP